MIEKIRLCYVAHPYSPSNGKSIEENLKDNVRICNELMDRGFLFINPISMTHPFDVARPREYDFWITFTSELLKKCDVLINCPGWMNSKGCNIENNLAQKLGLEIIDFHDIIKYNLKGDLE